MRSFQLRIAAVGYEDRLWRQIVVPADTTFARLHNVLQALFDWKDDWEHQFTLGGLSLGRPDDTSGFEVENERKFRLDTQIPKRQTSFYYAYGFDDGWTFEVTFESEVAAPKGQRFQCVAGEGHPHAETVGGPESAGAPKSACDLAATNERLARA